MKIPRTIEWRAGAILLCAAVILLGLLIALTLVRTDVGLKVKGVMSTSKTGWMLTTEIPEGQLALLRRCKHIYLTKNEIYGQISNIDVSLASPSGIRTEIIIRDLKIEATPDTSQTVMLIKQKKVPVLKILLDSAGCELQTQNYVLVSAGGGADGYDLIKPCIKAWQRLSQRGIVEDRKMVIFTGPFMPQTQYDVLEIRCKGGPFHIDRFTSHFLHWMRCADLSISRAGYNTCMNILETRTRAILVPGSLVSDQDFRAHRLSELELANTLLPQNLTTDKMAKAIVEALSSAPSVHNIALNGATTTRDLIRVI